MKNTIQEKDGVYTLMRNGKAAVCPYRQPIVLPGQLQGQVQIMPHACNSQCPHFNYQMNVLNLSCGNSADISISDDNNKDFIL